MSQPPPPEDASPSPADAQPGDTWSLDAPSAPPPARGAMPVPPAEHSLPVVQAELTDVGAPPPGPPRRRGLKVLGIALATLLIVVGAAGAAAFLMLRGSGEVILDKVPAQADVVVTAYLDPAASQKVNLLRMASKFPALGDEAHLRDQLNQALDQLVSDVGMDHEDLAWVGSELGLYVEVRGANDVSYAVLIAADDPDAAKAFIERYRQGQEQRFGVTYHTVDHDGVEVAVPSGDPSGQAAVALFDGVVVLGSTEAAVDAAIDTAHGGSTIADDPGFQRVTAALPDAKLGMAFVDAAHLADAFGDQLAAAGVTTGVTSISALDGIGVALSAQPDGLAMDTVMMYDDEELTDSQRATLSAPDHANPLLDVVPADVLGMYAVEHLDMSIQDSIEQITRTTPEAADQLDQMGVTGPDGLLSQLTGDVAVEGSAQGGTIPYGGALLVGTNDPGATSSWLDHALRQLPLGRSSYEPTKDGGFRIVQHPVKWATVERGDATITYASGAQLPFAYTVVGDVAVVATSPEQIEAILDARSSGSTISSDPGFTSAIATVPTSDGVLYVDVPAIVDSVRGQLPPDELDPQVIANLAPIEAVVAGSENSADEQRMRLLVRIP
jgi:Protein of unknown function (DUF3352)